MEIKDPHAERVFKQYPYKMKRYSDMTMHDKDSTGIIIVTLDRTSHKKGSKTIPNTSYMR